MDRSDAQVSRVIVFLLARDRIRVPLSKPFVTGAVKSMVLCFSVLFVVWNIITVPRARKSHGAELKTWELL